MKNPSLAPFRVIFALAFVGTLIAGLIILKNYEKLFGVDRYLPSENSSARSYGKVQVLAIWLHAVALTGALALLMED
jgi:hypothetical protein